MSKYLSPILVILVVAIAVACSGGGSASSLTGSSSVVATGTITGFGSIFVNGVHFQTTAATIRKNGVVVTQSKLAVGEIARIKGSKAADGTGIAESIDVDENVVGPIAAIDNANSMLTVLGQSVKVNGGTSFSSDIQPSDITGLKVGDLVRICGLVDSAGNVVATRIELGAVDSVLQVMGAVTGIDTTAHTFMINALLVDYTSAAVNGFTSGMPANGDLVEVQGTAFDLASTMLTATRVIRMTRDHEDAGNHEDTEREGLITRFATSTDFDVAGSPVTTTNSTVFRNGTAADLALNVKIEVEGTFDANNVLVASVIALHRNGNVEFEASVTAVDATAGTLTLLGVPVTVSSNTRFEDESSTQVEMFSLANVAVGDTVRVHGYESPAGSGMVVATRVERRPPGTTVLIDGPFAAGTSPAFTVLGIAIDGSTATLTGSDNAALTLTDFLAQAVGQEVSVQGTLAGNSVVATRARIDHHHDGGGDD